MIERELKFTLRVYKNITELSTADAALLNEAKRALDKSYSPYSNFKVGAAILLENGQTVSGANQENASFPAGICAEGVTLSAASAVYPNVPIKKIAITVKNEKHPVGSPVGPCGICRQRLLEYEKRFNNDIEIIMAGENGEVYSVKSVKDLLPLRFSEF